LHPMPLRREAPLHSRDNFFQFNRFGPEARELGAHRKQSEMYTAVRERERERERERVREGE
jgi:hypothetical protein